MIGGFRSVRPLMLAAGLVLSHAAGAIEPGPAGEVSATVAPPPPGNETPAVTADPAPPAPAAVVVKPEPIRLDPPGSDRLRPSLLPLAQPLWSELSASQQQVLAPFSEQWNGLPITEKRAWADLARRFPKMQAAEQERVQRRISEWAALTPDQRRLARANYRLAKQQEVKRENLIAEWETYQTMTTDQRSVLDAVGTSNTAARHVAARTGLAKIAAQPLPRRAPVEALSVSVEGSAGAITGVKQTSGSGRHRR